MNETTVPQTHVFLSVIPSGLALLGTQIVLSLALTGGAIPSNLFLSQCSLEMFYSSN